jgi:transcriptional regulator of acetoin/glycerol metabolism
MRLEPGHTLRHLGKPAARPAAVADVTWRPVDALAALDTGDAALRAAIARVRRVLDKAAIPLLLHGETGTGKDVFARALHASSGRRGKPFVAVNCAALPETLIEAELFGHCPGAFTGASRQGSLGRIREADGGTLFLDEIGDMPLALQARLLRVLEAREVTPLGSSAAVAVDFRLVCASHRRLKEEVAAGRFREDLYYRLNGLTLTLPPLRDRSDLATLVDRLLKAEAPDRTLRMDETLLAALARLPWPGNVRQLAHALRTAVALLDEGASVLTESELPEELQTELTAAAQTSTTGQAGVCADQSATDDLRQLTDARIRMTLAAVGGNVSEAARKLGISRNTLYRRLRR